EGRDGLAPVRLVAIRAPLLARDLSAMRDQSRAAAARDDAIGERRRGLGHRILYGSKIADGGRGRDGREGAMADAARRALLEEMERAFLEFADFVVEIPRDLYDVPVPGEEGSVRQILRHVVEAGYGHVAQMAPHVGGKEAARRFPSPVLLDDP